MTTRRPSAAYLLRCALLALSTTLPAQLCAEELPAPAAVATVENAASVENTTPAENVVDSTNVAMSTSGSPTRAGRSLPRWEWGVGIAAAHLRDYPGSSHSSTYALPLPWFVWRSERVEVGREGGRGILFRTAQLELDFTLMANPPSDSGDNPERAGMQPLDAVIEPGLRLRWRHTLDERGRWRVGAHLPVRYAAAMQSSLHIRGLGLHSEPGISLDNTLSPAWSWGVSASVGFAENGYADYYYGVSAIDATPSRPVYTAHGGYTGWLLGGRLSWRHENLSAGFFARYENLAGATFADSPLVTTDHGVTVGLSASWRLGQSRNSVRGD